MSLPSIAKVSYTHDAMIDLIMERPYISHGELAEHFGYSETWISIIVNSDAFQMKLAERREQVLDPLIRAQHEEAIKGLVMQSIAILREKLAGPNKDTDLALEVFKASTRAAGYGARPTNVNVSVTGEGSLVNILSGMDSPPPQEKVVSGSTVSDAELVAANTR